MYMDHHICSKLQKLQMRIHFNMVAVYCDISVLFCQHHVGQDSLFAYLKLLFYMFSATAVVYAKKK